MKQRYVSFKSKLRIIILFISTVVLILALLITGYVNLKERRQSLLENTIILAKSTAYNLAPTLTFYDTVSAKNILNSLDASPYLLTAIVFDATGEQFARFNPAPIMESSADITYKKEGYFFSYKFNKESLNYYHPINVKGKQIGTLFIQISLRQLSNYLKQYFLFSVVILVFALPFILVLTELLQRSITRPLFTLTKTIHEIQEQGNYSTRVQKNSEDEIGDLITDFNQMLVAIEYRDQQLIKHQATLEQQVNERTQELLIAKEVAEKANLAKSEFLSSMSHELRTPMNSILGFSQLVEMDELTPEHKEANDAILKAGYHLLGLIDKILDLSKIELGHLSLNKEHCSLNMILSDCINLIRPLADARQLKINCSIDENKDHDLEVDLTRLSQVLINILSNAVKYNRLAGVIIIKHDRIDNDIRISITDSGNGLTDEQMAKVFLPFERLNAANSAIEGTGVGLTICKKIITAMKGDIGVSSKKGEGTTFWISFPVR